MADDVEELILQLNSEYEWRRSAACAALGTTGDVRALGPLIERLGDTDRWVRARACEALGKIGDPRAVEPLIQRLDDADWGVRRAACVGLGGTADPTAVEPLLRQAVHGYDEDVRRAARKALVAIGAPAVPAVITRLGSENGYVRKAACEALGRMADPRAVGPLINRLADAYPPVRRVACLALGRIGDRRALDPLITSLTDAYLPTRRAARKALAQLEEGRLANVIGKCLDAGEGTLGEMAAMLKEGDSRPIEILIRTLTQAKAEVRQRACRALAQLGDRRAVEPLIQRLGDKDQDVRRTTCEALGQIEDPRAVHWLIQRLDDADWRVRQAACKALGQIGDSRAVEPLIQRLDDEDNWSVPDAACEALDKLGEGTLAQATLRLAAGDGDPAEVLRSMAVGGDIRAADPLISRIRRRRGEAPGSVCRALQSISDAIAPQVNQALCRECLCRLRRETTKLSALRKVEYYVCRSCGKAGGALFGIREVVATLDRDGSAEPIWEDGSVKANWLKRRSLFDFDRVEVLNAYDEDAERFCVQVGNDTDDIRRKTYEKVSVMIAPECRLEENTLRNLRGLFGKVCVGDSL